MFAWSYPRTEICLKPCEKIHLVERVPPRLNPLRLEVDIPGCPCFSLMVRSWWSGALAGIPKELHLWPHIYTSPLQLSGHHRPTTSKLQIAASSLWHLTQHWSSLRCRIQKKGSREPLNGSLREGLRALCQQLSVPDEEVPAGRRTQQPFGQRLLPPGSAAPIIHLQNIWVLCSCQSHVQVCGQDLYLWQTMATSALFAFHWIVFIQMDGM